MSYQSKQIQSFNGEEQLEFKQGKGRFNLFAKLSQLAAYIVAQVPVGTGIVETVVAGDGITIDDTDPANPIVNAEASGVGGSGTANILSKFTAASTLGNSSITDNGTLVSTAIPIKGSRIIAKTDLDANYELVADGLSLLSGNVALGLTEVVNRKLEFFPGGSGIEITDTGNDRTITYKKANNHVYTDNNDVILFEIDATGAYHSGDKLAIETAASGSFTTSDAKTVTVVNGIITSIV